MEERIRKIKPVDILNIFGLIFVSLFCIIDVIKYASLGDSMTTWTYFVINTLFILVSYMAYKFRMPYLYLLVAGFNIWLRFFIALEANFTFGQLLYGKAAIAAFVAIFGTIALIADKTKLRKGCLISPILTLAIIVSCLATWGIATKVSDSHQEAMNEIWSVPDKFDKVECKEKGQVLEGTYKSKAYATDEREVTKPYLLYLPYGYDESKQYNILYLMHGTGNDERYWLETYSYNVTMLDNLIYYGIIDPLIVVTPTWYVENDCEDDLDVLTYTFKEELRNDLMPYIETRYSTYAGILNKDDSLDYSKEFIESRDQRAFAGLSRGAFTTIHSALCESLDYFSYFGAFSAIDADTEYLNKTLLRPEFDQYKINYLYVTSGTFDFLLPSQLQQYSNMLNVAGLKLRLNYNTSFDVFPMRYHSMGSWHLALYNFVQKIF